MNSKHISILLLLAVFTLNACRSKKSIPLTEQKNLRSAEQIHKEKVISDIPASSFNFNFLTSKAKVHAVVKGKDYNLTFNIRMQKDQKIWISVNAIGSIEVVRILMNKDSVRIIDRLNNQYIVRDYDFISDLLQTEVDFNLIQDIMIGNVPMVFDLQKAILNENDQTYQLVDIQTPPAFQLGLQKSNMKLISLMMQEVADGKRKIEVNYADHRNVDNGILPFLITSVASSEKESLKLDVQYVKIDKADNLEFPFNVPKRFE